MIDAGNGHPGQSVIIETRGSSVPVTLTYATDSKRGRKYEPLQGSATEEDPQYGLQQDSKHTIEQRSEQTRKHFWVPSGRETNLTDHADLSALYPVALEMQLLLEK